MAGKNQHVVPYKNDWAVRGEKNSRVTTVTNTQAKAIDVARNIARNNQSEVVIHNRQGIIRDKDSYGRDPNPPKDKKH